MRSPIRLTLASLLAVATLALTSCAGEPGQARSDTDDDTVVIGLVGSPATISPASPPAQRQGGSIVRSIYSSLTRVDADLDVVGDVATDWEQVADNRWRFTLRDDVFFTDGTPLTADVVKWNFDEGIVKDDGVFTFASRSYLKAVSAVEVVDDTTLDIVTSIPEANIPNLVSIVLLQSPDFASSNDTSTTALGSGPYRLSSFDPQTETVLDVNENYYGEAPEVERAVFKYYNDDSQRINAVQSSEADIVIYLNPSSLASLETNAEYRVGAIDSNRSVFLKVNHADTVLQNTLIRQALNYGINKEELVEGVLKGYTDPSNGTLFTEGSYGIENPGVSGYPYDPNKAKELLGEAGYPDGLSLTLQYIPGRYVAVDLVAQNVKDQLATVGVTLDLETITVQQEQEGVANDTFGPLEVFGIAPNDSSWRSQLGHFDSSFYYNNWSNAEYDALLTQLRGTTESDQVARLFDDITTVFKEEAPVVFLYQQPLTYAVRSDLSFTVRPDEWLLPHEIRFAG